MDLLEKMNCVIEYIENNLEGDIDCKRISLIACSSSYQFHRMFSFVSDVSLTEYIRRRRLTAAALEIQGTNNKIIDIALKYGYDSPNSFTRAFQNLHGITPSLARKGGAVLKAFPKMTFQITIKGDVGMMYKVQEKEEIRLVGKKIMVNVEEYKRNSMNFRNEVVANKAFNELRKNSNSSTFYCITCYNEDNEKDLFSYHIACDMKKEMNITTDDFEVLIIPARKWVIIDVTDYAPELWKGWEKVYSQLLPTLGCTDTVGPELELFYDDGRCVFWISAKIGV